MAAVKKEAPTKSFFSSPSHTLKKLVNAFPKAQKQSHYSSQQQREGNQQRQHHQGQHPQQRLAVECVGEEDDCEDDVAELDTSDGYGSVSAHIPASLAAQEYGVYVENGVDDDTEYTGSSEGEYPRPRIREDLLPHDFSAWQKSPPIAPYPHSEASSSSREAESFSEVLSSSTSQDRHAQQDKHKSQGRHPRPNGGVEYHSNPSLMEQDRKSRHIEPHRYPSPTLTSAIASADLHLHKVRQNLPDLKLDIGLLGACRYGGGPAGLKGLPEDCWSVLNGASEDGRRNSVDGSCWQRRKEPDLVVTGGWARESVDTIPLSEACRAHQEDGHQRGNFQHHASMVYTRAPSREALAKKVADKMNSRRVSRNIRKVKKKSDAMWEEQENVPRRVQASDLSRSPRRVSYENSVDIAKLQSQVEELQRKLIVREGVLQSYHGVMESRNESPEMLLCMRRLEELQRKVAERDQMLESAKEDIAQKEDEIQAMKRCLKDTEETCTELRSRNANREEEVRALRCEVTALRWQIEIDVEKTRSEIETSVGASGTCECTDVQKQGNEPEVWEMEAVRKKYLAALVVARHVPREECLALVGVLRIQLQCILRMPTSHLP